MKVAILAAAFPLVVAHDAHLAARLAARQASSAAASAAPSAPAVSGAPASSIASVATATASFSLQSQNPTAFPLSSIVANAPSAATSPLTTTWAAGSTPSAVPGAPPLPNVATLVPSNYPALDKPPPSDSPQVQQWVQDVKNSGIAIPDIPVNQLGGCPNNTAAASNSSQTGSCWWTCGGCVRDTDVTSCPNKMTWGLTYDDGPSPYTSQLLTYLNEQSLKSTFFVVGSRVISYPQILQEEHMAGHQIGVHTWSHTALTTQTNEEIIAELGWTKKVIFDTLGVTPNTMRPPFGDIDDRVRAICTAMGLTPVMWTRISPMATFDTGDFDIHGGLTTVSQVLNNWENIIGNASVINTGFIVLEHDLFQQTVEVATGYILPDAIAHKFTIEPVVSCLNKPIADAYIETNDNKTNPPIASGGNVTLPSGAPGSAQESGSSGKNSAMTLRVDGICLSVVVGGLVAGLAMLL